MSTYPIHLPGTSATFASVGDSATSVTVLAANPKRVGASFRNTSSAILYLRFDSAGGAATATTGHSVALETGNYFELPFGYVGIVTGIWASDAGGAVNISEYSYA